MNLGLYQVYPRFIYNVGALKYSADCTQLNE
jgi:hypothetical protein